MSDSAHTTQTQSTSQQWRSDLDASALDGYDAVASRVQLHFGVMIAEALDSEQAGADLVSLQKKHQDARTSFERALRQHNSNVAQKLKTLGAEVRRVLVDAYGGNISLAVVKYYGYDVDKTTKYKGVQGAIREAMERMFSKRVCFAVQKVDDQLIPDFYCASCDIR